MQGWHFSKSWLHYVEFTIVWLQPVSVVKQINLLNNKYLISLLHFYLNQFPKVGLRQRDMTIYGIRTKCFILRVKYLYIKTIKTFKRKR